MVWPGEGLGAVVNVVEAGKVQPRVASDIQRAAASALFSGTVLNAMEVFGAVFQTLTVDAR
jgi:hypothetical protein